MIENNEASDIELKEILSEKFINLFNSKVKKSEKEDGCWEWQDSCNKKNGYGQVRVLDKNRRAHRIAMSISNKRIYPSNIMILHEKCHNAKCVRPSHLEEGAHTKNMKDMFVVGRHKNQIEEKTNQFLEAINRLSIVDKKLLHKILHKEIYGEKSI